MVGLVFGHQNHRGQGHKWQDQTLRQPRGPSAATCGSGLEFESVGAGCVLPSHVFPHGQAQGRRRRCSQADPTDLRLAHPRPGIHRPGGRTTLRNAAANASRTTLPRRPWPWHATRSLRQHSLKTYGKSISYPIFLEEERLGKNGPIGSIPVFGQFSLVYISCGYIECTGVRSV